MTSRVQDQQKNAFSSSNQKDKEKHSTTRKIIFHSVTLSFLLAVIRENRPQKRNKGWGATNRQRKQIFVGGRVKRAASKDVTIFPGGPLNTPPAKIEFSLADCKEHRRKKSTATKIHRPPIRIRCREKSTYSTRFSNSLPSLSAYLPTVLPPFSASPSSRQRRRSSWRAHRSTGGALAAWLTGGAPATRGAADPAEATRGAADPAATTHGAVDPAEATRGAADPTAATRGGASPSGGDSRGGAVRRVRRR